MAITTTFRTSQEDMDGNQNLSQTWGSLPYEDPALTNPAELATFPKQTGSGSFYHHDHDSHLVNKRTPARDGSNITRTGAEPNRHGLI